MKMIRVRIKSSGQVLEMVPSAAMPMILGGIAERLSEVDYIQPQPESAMLDPKTERAVSQRKPSAKKR